MYIDVIIPVAIPNPTFTYRCEVPVKVGARVVLPDSKFAHTTMGVVMAVHKNCPDIPEYKIKEVDQVVDILPLVTPKMMEYWSWISSYYITELGGVLRNQVSPIFSSIFSPRCPIKHVRPKIVALNPPSRLNFTFRSDAKTVLIHEHSPLDIAALVDELTSIDGRILILVPDSFQVKKIAMALDPWWSVETYDSKNALARRGGVIVDMACGLTPRIIVGTRSALSLPFDDLGAIVVMDEHSSAYRSPYVPTFSGRDAALYVAKLYGAKCFLVSPVPSVESTYNATNLEDWQRVETPAWEIAPLKHIVLEKGAQMISSYLINKITDSLGKSRKTVIFQNRRGFSSYVKCNKCGHVPQCPSCNTSLTYHLDRTALDCHYCGYSEPFKVKCAKCEGKLEPQGRGTQRLEQQLNELFPQAKILRLDSDTFVSAIPFKAFPQWDIIVGTQVLLDETIDFDLVDTLAIANADNMSPSANFRDTENTFRMISLLGRRARRVGAELVIQSSRLDNPSINMALTDDYDQMYNHEIQEREQTKYPPFVRLIEIDVRARKEKDVFEVAKALEMEMHLAFGSRISPIFQPLVSRQDGLHIVQMLLKIERARSMVEAKRKMLNVVASVTHDFSHTIRVNFNIDPL